VELTKKVQNGKQWKWGIIINGKATIRDKD